ncbi:class I SAM-dependent methyltransferase [Numidum massiliense]|uniref:class I SAM-dependent methyltransferase n=1 Tax=Numidum massiliense TaxID=1522315 RepID=UPI0006D57320|nr:class I SAM-dependent methyltransferase [Numidum massiliense]
MKRAKLIGKFDKQARMYEKRRKRLEQKQWRQKLLQTAEGQVLELGVGAGANFPFFDARVEVTAVDFSPEMLQKAREAAAEYGITAEFVQADIEDITFAPDSFDTVVSTLSLCSYNAPLRFLKKCRRWCKKDGRILLMEHGISSNRIVASVQKVLNPLSYRVVGCHQTRDVMDLIRSSGIVVERAEHYLAGMVHLVWAKPD